MVSIIIPTFNEEKNIENIQNQLNRLLGDFEVIFSDGFSSDKTYEKIEMMKIREVRYRSNQMNKAVEYSKGDYIWFLHADSKIDRYSVIKIEESNALWGCFELKFDSKKFMMKIVSKFSNWRARYRKIVFGDQGIFIRKSLFEEIGGYESIPLMEDYELSIRLKKKGIRPSILKLPIVTSSRRFDKNGIFKTIILMQKLQRDYRKGKDIYEIHKKYTDRKNKK